MLTPIAFFQVTSLKVFPAQQNNWEKFRKQFRYSTMCINKTKTLNVLSPKLKNMDV